MNCKNCGSPLTQADQFCRNCGATVNAQNMGLNNNTPNIQQSGMSSTMGAVNNQGSMFGDVTNILNKISDNNSGVPATNHIASTPVSPIPTVENPQYAHSNDMSYMGSYNNSAYQSNNNNNNNNNNKGSGTGKYIVMAIIAVAVIAAVVIVVISLGQQDKTSNNNGNSTSTTTPISTANVSKVRCNGFIFNVPNDLIYETEANKVVIADETETWLAALEFIEVNYSTLSSNMNSLQSLFASQGITVSTAKKNTYSGVEYITLEGSMDGAKILIAMAKIDSTHSLVAVIYSINNDYNYSVLDKIAPITSSIKAESASHSIAPKAGIDMNVLTQLGK